VGRLRDVVTTVALTIGLFLVLQTFVAQPYRVEGASMEDTLPPGTFVLIDKLTPRWAPFERGDIVVFHPPGRGSSTATPYIKRVIGLPGDRVELRDGRVLVNGVELEEDYLFAGADGPGATDPEGRSDWVVPDGDLFVMGDHRADSQDSRSFGPIPIESVIGRAALRYWPLDAFGGFNRPDYPELGGS
jgi:signal peptidase I